jgi:hypothetical protein
VIVNSESIKSHATSDGLFLYTCIYNTLKYNFVLYSTISESYYIDTSGSPAGTIFLAYGQIRIISSNSSDNYCYRASSFHLVSKDNSDYSSQLKYSTDDCYVHYCYIMNNIAKNLCILFYGYTHKCEESNIINNSEVKNYVTIYCLSSATVKIIKCCLINNNANNIGCLFFVDDSTSTMEVRECIIQNGYSVYGAVTTSYSNTEAESQCAKIYYCGARIDRSCEQCGCSVYDNILINNLQRLYVNKPFLI